MYLRSLVLSILLFAPMAARASDALIFAAVYECHADEVNRDMAEACKRTFPELSAIASDALAIWRARNADKAKQIAATCEPAAFQAQALKVKEAIRTGFLAQMRERGKSACVVALEQLSTGAGAMDLK